MAETQPVGESEVDQGGSLADADDGVSESMSVKDISVFLHRHGIPQRFCEVFEENYIDGTVFLTLTEGEVKTMVPPLGLVRKIIKLIPQSRQEPSPSEVSQCNLGASTPPPAPSPSSGSTVSVFSVPSGTSTPSTRREGIAIPDHWRPEIETCLRERCLNDGARNEMVRSLVNQLFARASKPTRFQCENLARKLILKYPFVKDDMGNGYQSWADKMVERVRNVIKRDNKKARGMPSEEEVPEPKRRKKGVELLRRYPVSNSISTNTHENAESLELHKKAMGTELAKAKPRDSVLLPLMRSTYGERRVFILNEATSVQAILQTHRALSRPAIIEQEMGLIFGKSDIKSQFLTRWSMEYVPAIITYAQKSTKRNISNHIEQLDETDQTSKELTALRILSECLAKGRMSLCYLYEECMEPESIEGACVKPPVRPQPRIAAFVGEDSYEYFVICEQQVLCKVPNFQSALFISFSAFYCFNLEYPTAAKNVLCFFQDYILAHPDSSKKSGAYLGVVSDIKRNI